MAGGEPDRLWELAGYLEDTFNVEYLRREQSGAWLNAGRGRLNLSLKPTRWLDLGFGVVGTYNSGETRIDSLRYLPEDTPILAPDPDRDLPRTRDVLGYSLENDLHFQEAFVTLYLPRLRLRVGRHKLYSGTGYAFNPTDPGTLEHAAQSHERLLVGGRPHLRLTALRAGRVHAPRPGASRPGTDGPQRPHGLPER